MQSNNTEKIFLESLSLIPDCKGAVLGVSGGPDSMAMLHMFIVARDSGKLPFPIVCATLNHGLRPEAEEETEGVRKYCEEHDVPFVTQKTDVKATLPKGESVESHARSCRYRFFEEVKAAYGCTHTVTAHNADDNFESVILNLTRGCGTDGLCGISPLRKDNNTLRPLLGITKAQLTEYCDQNGIPYYIDRTNLDTAYRRNFIRNRITPLFREMNPSLEDAVYRLTAAAAEDCDLLDSLAAAELNRALTDKGLSLAVLKKLHPAILARVLRQYAKKVTGATPTFLDTESLKELVTQGKTSSKRQVSGRDFTLTYTHLTVMEPTPLSQGFTPFTPVMGENSLPQGTLVLTAGENYAGQKNCFSFLEIAATTLRTREEGDYMRTPQGSGKLLKKLYIDKKIPREDRPSLPILTLDGKIVWAAGIGAAKEFIPQRGTLYIKAEYIRKKENIHE